MPRGRFRATVVLFSTPGSLAGIDGRLTRAGVRLVRLVAAEPRPVPPGQWLPRLVRAPPPQLVVVTSRAAVDTGVRPWRKSAGGRSAQVRFWAAGPTTARALRSIGVRSIRRAPELGADGIAAGLAKVPPARVLYFRSDRAGTTLARALRRHGHVVTEVIAYRVTTRATLSARADRAVSAADLLVATSPSALDAVPRRGSIPTAGTPDRLAPLVVLGARSRRAARARGFRSVRVAPSPDPERFTRFLLRELEHAGS